MVKVGQDFHPDLKLAFDTRTADHEILNIAYRLARKQPKRQVILVSKDVNLRMKAKAIGLTARTTAAITSRTSRLCIMVSACTNTSVSR